MIMVAATQAATCSEGAAILTCAAGLLMGSICTSIQNGGMKIVLFQMLKARC